MTVKIEKSGPVWTVIHNRPEAAMPWILRVPMALTKAFLEFDADDAGASRCCMAKAEPSARMGI